MHDSVSDDDRRIVQEMTGRFGAPAFMRRAKIVETTWSQLLETGNNARRERLQMVRLRLGQLHALSDRFKGIERWLPHQDDRAELSRLHEELQPELRMPLEPTTSRWVLRWAVRDLLEAMESFNERWARWLALVDLTAVNKARDDYNRYYVLEKECAVGSIQVAWLGFRRLEPIAHDEIAQLLPLLVLPRFVLD